MRQLFAEPLQQIDRTYVLSRGRRLSYFAGCDYFRLSSHPEIVRALRKALDEFGLNVSASRKTTGNHRLYHELEMATRQFFGAEAAVVSSTGYFTNIIAAQALRGSIDQVVIDQCAHGSLRDAAIFLGCPITEFGHRDAADLKNKIAWVRGRYALLTDGMFSHNGSSAPLGAYREIIGRDELLWVDDAHAGGIMGKRGRGIVELAGLSRRNLIQTVTFSKAFGTYGGAILCERAMAERISEKSCAVSGNTPIPLPIAGATIRALELCNVALRAKLAENVKLFWTALNQATPDTLTPIISFAPENPSILRRRLLAGGIYPPLIKYPGGPAEGYFRFALSSEHSPAQIKTLAKVLAGFTSTLMR